jgi:phosphoglycerate dehydrogenase-like enzyme
VRVFRVALTGDFLDDSGAVAYGDAGLGDLEGRPDIRWHFLMDLAPKPGEPTYWSRLYSMEITPDQIRGVDGLVVLRPWVKRSTFATGAEDLVVIGRSGAGYDKIDLDACTEHGVAVFNAPLALNHATASSALLFILALAKRLPDQERIVRQGRWDRQAAVMGSELQDRTLGIIGLGHTGRELARLVAPFQMRLLAHSPHADPAEAQALGVRLTSLEEVLRVSDFVSLHCRLTPETRQMIDAAQLTLMKPTAYLINVARGELVDQAALVDTLRQRRIAGAGLDVFEVEPLPLGDPLLDLDNVILTPHWLASSSDIWTATGKAMVAGMLRAARGERPENIVNPDVLARAEFHRKLSRFAENQVGIRPSPRGGVGRTPMAR